MKTMNYLYNKKKKKRNLFYLFISILLILAIFTRFYSFLYDLFEKPFLAVYQNTEELKSDSRKLFQSVFRAGQVFDENEKLKAKVEKLEINVMKEEYFELLVRELENIISSHEEVSLTHIIRKGNGGVLTILGGDDYGFTSGDFLIGSDGVLVGEITDVFDKSSIVHLFTFSGTELDCVLYDDLDTLSIHTIGNGNALTSELNREVNIEVGDVVYSQLKPGYVVGTVSYIDFDPRDPVKKVYIAPIHSIQSLQNVGVIKK